MSTNPITQLRLKRAKSKRAPMPVSKKPRRPHAEAVSRINFFSEAGKLLYGRLIAAVTGIRFDYTMEIMMEREERKRARSKRLRSNGSWKPAANGARECARECARRMRQHLTQHPSVIARFANHPTRAQIESEIERHERFQSIRRDALTLETA